MKRVRHMAFASTVLGLALCGWSQAQVLEQVPDNAVAVFKVNALQTVSAKAGKLAKAFGLDQLSPEVGDPLAALQEKTQISKGLNKAGDMAVVFFDPEAAGHVEADAGAKHGNKEPHVLVLIPTDDFKAFVSNFQDAKEEGGITEAKSPEGGKTVYLAHWGAYAAMSPEKPLVEKKPTGGLKLEGAAANESQTKDAILYANMTAIRAKALPKLKENREQILSGMLKGQQAQPNAKQFEPVFKAVDNMFLDAAQQFLQDTRSSMISINLSDEGISTSGLADFTPDSKFGQIVADLKGSDQSLLGGLPDRKYFMFGGASLGQKVTAQFITTVLDPITQELAKTDEAGKAMAGVLDAFKGIMQNTDSSAMGIVVPTGAIGQEGLLTSVRVLNGNAPAIRKAMQETVTKAADLLKNAVKAQEGKGSATVAITPDAKKVDGVSLDEVTVKIEVDPNDPHAAQAQQMMAMIYGPNGMGGLIGAVNDKTVVGISGANEKLIADAIAAAKSGKDNLGILKNVQVVTAQLPKQRFAEYYVALDQIIGTAARYAQQFGMPIKLKLPADLPPIGVAAATEGSSVRVESFIPTELVKSLVAAGLDAYQNVRQGGGGGGAGGL